MSSNTMNWEPINDTKPLEYGLYSCIDEDHPEIVIQCRLTAKGWFHRHYHEGHTIPEFMELTHYREMKEDEK